MASNFELFGMVILEIMTNQILAICGSNGYSKEIINDYVDGLVAISGNSNSIAECLQEFINEEVEREYGEVAYIKVKNIYSEEMVMKQLVNLYSGFME